MHVFLSVLIRSSNQPQLPSWQWKPHHAGTTDKKQHSLAIDSKHKSIGTQRLEHMQWSVFSTVITIKNVAVKSKTIAKMLQGSLHSLRVIQLNMYIHCVLGKKRPKCFFVKSPTKLRWFWWNLVGSLINFRQNHMNIFHLTWKMSLHYLVKLEMLITHKLLLSCSRNKLQKLNYSTLTVASRFELDYSVSGILREKVYKTYITDLELLTMPLMQTLRSGCCNDDVMLLGPFRSQLLFRFVQRSDERLVHLLLQYFQHAVINWIQIWWTLRP